VFKDLSESVLDVCCKVGNGRQRWVCRTCNRSFGATCGTPMYRLRNTPTEVARTLLVVMRRGSLSAAEDITGHKHETIGGGGRVLVVCQKNLPSPATPLQRQDRVGDA